MLMHYIYIYIYICACMCDLFSDSVSLCIKIIINCQFKQFTLLKNYLKMSDFSKQII